MGNMTLNAKFKPALAINLPKNVTLLTDSMKDGCYLAVEPVRDRYNGRVKAPAKTLLFVSENGHLYTIHPDDKGLKGLGKTRIGEYKPTLVQQVTVDFIVSDYKAPPKKKVVKKVAKKAASKKKAIRKKRR